MQNVLNIDLAPKTAPTLLFLLRNSVLLKQIYQNSKIPKIQIFWNLRGNLKFGSSKDLEQLGLMTWKGT